LCLHQEKQFILIAKQPFSIRKESNHSNKCAPKQHEDDIICHDTKVVFLLFKFQFILAQKYISKIQTFKFQFEKYHKAFFIVIH